MIIAYPLEDIVSYAGGRRQEEHPAEQRRGRKPKVIIDRRVVYQHKGKPTRVICFNGNMVILVNAKGEKFPAHKDRLIWHEL